jgi:hypothetical protein
MTIRLASKDIPRRSYGFGKTPPKAPPALLLLTIPASIAKYAECWIEKEGDAWERIYAARVDTAKANVRLTFNRTEIGEILTRVQHYLDLKYKPQYGVEPRETPWHKMEKTCLKALETLAP